MRALKYFTCVFLLTLTSRIYSQIPDTIWTKTFGGSLADVGNSVMQTNDGGFIVAGTTSSFGAGGQDVYLIKTDENGDTLWTKTFGGTGNDRASKIVQTIDNGYAIFGTTNSYGNNYDFLLLKVDSVGNSEWHKTFDAGLTEYGFDGLQTKDNGYIILGTRNYPSDQGWLIKTDPSGNGVWNKLLDGYNYAPFYGYSVTQTTDSGYAVCGYTHFYTPWTDWRWSILYRLSSTGDVLHFKYYNFTSQEVSFVVRETHDGNLILGGTNLYYSFERLLKVTHEGDIVWNKEIAGVQSPAFLNSLEIDIDNGFIFSVIPNGNPPINPDFELIKCDVNGDLVWKKRIGGSQSDFARSVNLTNDSGYVVVGESKSFGVGDNDVWLMKFKYPPSPKIQLSKDSLNLTFDGVSFTSKDSLVIYNTGDMTLNIDTIYSTNASGFILDIFLKDTTIHSAVTWRSSYYNPFEIEPHDSAKLIFTYPLWIPKSINTTEIWNDTIIILNNSVNTSSLVIPTLIDFPLGIDSDANSLPLSFSLSQNYPNPFNPSTVISYRLPAISNVTLKIYDVLGNEITTLVNEEKQPGTYEVEFNGTELPSGIYFYQLKAGNYIETKKMVLIK